jgi:beta-ureidopropionase / N-carbamoyl-L-amino-acid hydrolase
VTRHLRGERRPLRAPDRQRLADDLEHLAQFVEPGTAGWTRRVFSDAYRASRPWVAERMGGAGLDVSVDEVGNVVGRRHGTSGRRSGAVVIGSHTDTVADGGRFDGTVGVLGAIEVARMLEQSGADLVRDLVVVDFLGEEPNQYGVSCVGSRAIAGTLTRAHLLATAADGSVLADRLGDADEILAARWDADDACCYLELHIEQGPRLERASARVGFASGIVGVERLHVEFGGRADHAGTASMADRRDALCGAAALVASIEDAARRAGEGYVATCGRLAVDPNAVNVVPASVAMWPELRSMDDAWLADTRCGLERLAREVAASRELTVSIDTVSSDASTPATPWVVDLLRRHADALGLAGLELPSGAEHDARQMARLAPWGMLFVPSRDGRSHCPEEWTDVDDVADAVGILARAVVDLGREGPPPPA